MNRAPNAHRLVVIPGCQQTHSKDSNVWRAGFLAWVRWKRDVRKLR